MDICRLVGWEDWEEDRGGEVWEEGMMFKYWVYGCMLGIVGTGRMVGDGIVDDWGVRRGWE